MYSCRQLGTGMTISVTHSSGNNLKRNKSNEQGIFRFIVYLTLTAEPKSKLITHISNTSPKDFKGQYTGNYLGPYMLDRAGHIILPTLSWNRA